MTRLYGRAPTGQRVRDSVPTGTWNSTTLVAGVRASGPVAPLALSGAMDGEIFTVYAGDVLAPVLQPDDIVVMDNLSSHKNSKARAALEAAGVRILDLPPYSPDLNPIEKMWSKIKALLRGTKARSFEALVAAIGKALTAVTQEDIRGWFQSCGYGFT